VGQGAVRGDQAEGNGMTEGILILLLAVYIGVPHRTEQMQAAQ
jgi:hypothetical protein